MRLLSSSILIAAIFLLTACNGYLKPVEDKIEPAATGIKPTGNENRIVFVSGRDGQSDVYSMKPDGSDIVRITNDPEVDTTPVWSPDRSQLAYVSYVAGGGELDLERSKIFIINADGTERRKLFDRPQPELFPAWSPDGTQILYALHNIFLASADGKRDELLLTDAEYNHLHTPVWSPDGREIAFVDLQMDNGVLTMIIRIMSRDGSNIRTLTNGYAPAWSPDGRRIVFQSLYADQYDISIINVDGSGLQQLTNTPAYDENPDWSPDGNQIVFMSSPDDNDDIYVINADGTNPVRLTDDWSKDRDPAWYK